MVALVREVYLPAVRGWAGEFLADGHVLAGAAAWEQLFTLTEGNEQLVNLRTYLADKSVNLRRAFKLDPA